MQCSRCWFFPARLAFSQSICRSFNCIMQLIRKAVNNPKVAKTAVLLEQGGGYHYRSAGFGGTPRQVKKTASLSLENWIGYRFVLVATRLGNFVAPMYARRHHLSPPAWLG